MNQSNSTTSRSPGQRALMSVARILDNKDMGAVLREASIDDLEWFLQMLDYQLEETPHWVKDKDLLHKIQAWDRRVRTVTAEVLHNKRVKARPLAQLQMAGGKLLYIAIGGLLTLALTKLFG